MSSLIVPSATSAQPPSSGSSLSWSGGDTQRSVSRAGASSMKFSPLMFSTYVAQDARAEITPRFSMPAVECMSGTFGPFSPNYPVIVPLWLAVYFRQTGTCTITPPVFLSKAYLEALLDRECKTDVTFEMMPFHFFEIAKLFFSACCRGCSRC